jgi:hypothetical protein
VWRYGFGDDPSYCLFCHHVDHGQWNDLVEPDYAIKGPIFSVRSKHRKIPQLFRSLEANKAITKENAILTIAMSPIGGYIESIAAGARGLSGDVIKTILLTHTIVRIAFIDICKEKINLLFSRTNCSVICCEV